MSINTLYEAEPNALGEHETDVLSSDTGSNREIRAVLNDFEEIKKIAIL